MKTRSIRSFELQRKMTALKAQQVPEGTYSQCLFETDSGSDQHPGTDESRSGTKCCCAALFS